MARLIDQIKGHAQQKQQLLEMIQADHMPSSFIFHGPSGVGKKTLVRALLQVMNCSEDPISCGECSNCQRALD